MTLQRKIINEIFNFITQNGHKTNHTKFLQSTTIFLAELFKGIDILVDKYSIKKPTNVEIVAFYRNGSFMPNQVIIQPMFKAFFLKIIS